ncbi:MAG TPA: hypothetical protein VLH38_01285 [Patescibacteria group bacterium]|nr:hypothetical protein [Patescibacteria group bacterium]
MKRASKAELNRRVDIGIAIFSGVAAIAIGPITLECILHPKQVMRTEKVITAEQNIEKLRKRAASYPEPQTADTLAFEELKIAKLKGEGYKPPEIENFLERGLIFGVVTEGLIVIRKRRRGNAIDPHPITSPASDTGSLTDVKSVGQAPAITISLRTSHLLTGVEPLAFPRSLQPHTPPSTTVAIAGAATQHTTIAHSPVTPE